MEKKERKMKCPFCKEEISINAKECPHCGKSLKINNVVAGIITAFIFIVIIIVIVSNGKFGNGNNYERKIENSIGVSSEQSKQINDILESTGLNSFESISHDEILDDEEGKNTTAYRIKTDFSDNVILYLDSSNRVISIRWINKDFYRDGKVLLSFKDYTITIDEKVNYMTNSESVIKQLLKAPSSAKFPNITEWSFSKDKGVVTLQSYVDSQNSFGAMIRSDFKLKYNKNKVITSLVFDDVEYIK